MEHEIIGHSNKALKILRNPEKTFWEKTKEILIEVLIIVFAVTFAAYIERSREHSKEESEAKEFALGLKSDLKYEINHLKESKNAMDTMVKNYTSIMHLKKSAVDSLNKNHIKSSFYIPRFNSHPVNGRYDGFKSSGRIQTIEDDSLRNNILTLHEEDLPFIEFSESVFNGNQKRLEDLLINSSDTVGDKPADVVKLLTSAKGRFILDFALNYSSAVVKGYDNAIADAEKVIREIDKIYKQ
jgi:hypothetical protein